MESDNKYSTSLYRETAETTNSLKFSLGVAHRTTEIGIETAKELSQQGLQMDGIERNLEQIDNNNTIASRYVRSIKSTFGTFVNFFSRTPTTSTSTSLIAKDDTLLQFQYELPKSIEESELPYNTHSNTPQSAHNLQHDKVGSKEYSYADSSQYAFLNDTALQYELEEQDRGLDELQSIISNLHGIAQTMNFELDDQNKRLKNIAPKVDSQNERIKYTTGEVKELLK